MVVKKWWNESNLKFLILMKKCNQNNCESGTCSVTGFQDLWLTGSVILFDVGDDNDDDDDDIGYYIWLFPCNDKLESFKSRFPIQNYPINLTIFRPMKCCSNLFFHKTSIISVDGPRYFVSFCLKVTLTEYFCYEWTHPM